MEFTQGVPVPPLRHYLGEARIAVDWMRGRLAEDRLASNYPGDGRAVIVIPGLFTSDSRTRMLRRVLKKAGYRTYGWGLGRNMPIRSDILDRFGARVAEVQAREGGQVTLIGWSLGGLIARAYAKHAAESVAGVITLGTPFSGDPRSNRAWKIYELVADHTVDNPPVDFDRATKPPVPTTAIWSSRDGIISVDAARGLPHERDSALEIDCGHFAMAAAPDALEAVLVALRGQPRAAAETSSAR
jgi:pimeloyl-ACP methyl ester carboxylesterase